jgi:hypothetical protein
LACSLNNYISSLILYKSVADHQRGSKLTAYSHDKVIQMSRQAATSLRYNLPAEETVEQFLARGGRIQRIEDHPDPDGRVLLRGQHFNAGPVRPPMGASLSGITRVRD